MQLSNLLSSGALTVPWPTAIDGVALSTSSMPMSITCTRKCSSKPECSGSTTPGEHQCVYGMTYFCVEVSQQVAVVYGIRGESNSTPLNKYTKDGLKGRSVKRQEVESWASKINDLLKRIEGDFAARQTEMLDPLHDPIRLAKQINTIANRLVQLHSIGPSFESQLENASLELKTLVKASDLLSDSFDLLTIYFNPNAATFGRKSAISLHGLITKLIAIFRIDDGGVTRSSAKIFMNGSCYRNVFAHESFKLIPFALLSNAVKYSMQGNIEVHIDDRNKYVDFSVTSVGPAIDDDERELIFCKKGRGRWATKLVDGKGVGLFLADQIARAHGTQIRVNSSRLGSSLEGIPLARNTFIVQVPIG